MSDRQHGNLTPFEAIGIPPTTDWEVIHRAWRKKSTGSYVEDGADNVESVKLNWAKEQLKDPYLRGQWVAIANGNPAEVMRLIMLGVLVKTVKEGENIIETAEELLGRRKLSYEVKDEYLQVRQLMHNCKYSLEDQIIKNKNHKNYLELRKANDVFGKITDLADKYERFDEFIVNSDLEKLIKELDDYTDEFMNNIWSYEGEDFDTAIKRQAPMREALRITLDDFIRKMDICNFDNTNNWPVIKAQRVLSYKGTLDEWYKEYWATKCSFIVQNKLSMTPDQAFDRLENGFVEGEQFSYVPYGIKGHFVFPPGARIDYSAINAPCDLIGITLDVDMIQGGMGLSKCNCLRNIRLRFNDAAELVMPVSLLGRVQNMEVQKSTGDVYIFSESIEGGFAVAGKSGAYIYDDGDLRSVATNLRIAAQRNGMDTDIISKKAILNRILSPSIHEFVQKRMTQDALLREALVVEDYLSIKHRVANYVGDKLTSHVWECENQADLDKFKAPYLAECVGMLQDIGRVKSEMDALGFSSSEFSDAVRNVGYLEDRMNERWQRINNANIEETREDFWIRKCWYKNKDSASSYDQSTKRFKFENGFDEDDLLFYIPPETKGHFVCPPQVRVGSDVFGSNSVGKSELPGITFWADMIGSNVDLSSCKNLKHLVFRFDDGTEQNINTAKFGAVHSVRAAENSPGTLFVNAENGNIAIVDKTKIWIHHREVIKNNIAYYIQEITREMNELNSLHGIKLEKAYNSLKEKFDWYADEMRMYLQNARDLGFFDRENEIRDFFSNYEITLKIYDRQIKYVKLQKYKEETFAALDKLHKGKNDFLRRVYDSEETPESYQSHYDHINQTILSFRDYLEQYQADTNSFTTCDLIWSQLYSYVDKFLKLPGTYEDAMNGVIITENMYDEKWRDGIPVGTVFYKVKFAPKKHFDTAYDFIDCKFEEGAYISAGSNLDGCVCGKNTAYGTFHNYENQEEMWGRKVKNGTIVNSLFDEGAFIGETYKPEEGVVVENSIFIANCDLGKNNTYLICVFGVNCRSSYGDNYIDGLGRDVAPIDSKIIQDISAELMDCNDVFELLKENRSNNIQTEYDPLADRYNNFLRNDVSLDPQGYIDCRHILAMEVVVIPGQKFRFGEHTVEVSEDASLLINGAVPCIDGQPVEINCRKTTGRAGVSFNVRSNKILLQDKQFVFSESGVYYGLLQQEQTLDIPQIRRTNHGDR